MESQWFARIVIHNSHLAQADLASISLTFVKICTLLYEKLTCACDCFLKERISSLFISEIHCAIGRCALQFTSASTSVAVKGRLL